MKYIIARNRPWKANESSVQALLLEVEAAALPMPTGLPAFTGRTTKVRPR